MGGRGSASPGSKSDEAKNDPLRIGEAKENYLPFGEEAINLAEKLSSRQLEQLLNTGIVFDELQTELNLPADTATTDETARNKKSAPKNWQKKFIAAVENDATSMERIHPEEGGYRITNRHDGTFIREVHFYPGFSWQLLEHRLEPALAREILQSPGLQRLMVETPDIQPQAARGKKVTAQTTLKRLWTQWERGKAKGKFSKVKSFTEYVGRNGYRVSTNEKTLLIETIINYDSLSESEKARAILITTEPELLTKLPPQIAEQVEDVLKNSNLLAKSSYLQEVRSPLIARVNNRIAYSLKDYNEFEAVMQAVEQPASRGAIAEAMVRRFFVGTRTSSLEARKPYFDKGETGLAHSIQPDMIRPTSRRTIDVKCGYVDSNIELEQLERYAELIEKSAQPEAKPGLKEKLEALGLAKPTLAGHDYIFVSDGRPETTRSAAARAYNMVRNANLEKRIGIYYIARQTQTPKQSDTANDSVIGVYRLKFSEDELEIVASWVGTTLPD